MYAFSPHFFLVLGGTGWLCDNYMFFMFSSQMHHGESTSLQCCYAVPLGVTGYLTDEWNPFFVPYCFISLLSLPYNHIVSNTRTGLQ